MPADELLSTDPHADELLSSDANAGTAAPFDVKKQNAILLGNMAKQADAGKPDYLSAVAHSGAMGVNLEGLNAAHEGNYAKAAHQLIKGSSLVTAPMILPAAAAAPVAVAGGMMLGAAGDVGGRKLAEQVTDNPDYIDLAGDAGGLVGGYAGAKGGQAVSDTVTPIVKALAKNPVIRKAAVGVVSPRAKNAADLATAVKEAINPTPEVVKPGKVVKPPPTLDEQLGVSPESLGSTIEATHAPVKPVVLQGSARGPEPVIERPNFNDQPEFVKQQKLQEYEALQPRAPEPQAAPFARKPFPTTPQEGAGARGSERIPVDQQQQEALMRQLELRRLGGEDAVRAGLNNDNWTTSMGSRPDVNQTEHRILVPDEENWFTHKFNTLEDKAAAPASFEVVGNSGEPVTTINGSGAPGGEASAEAVSRIAGMKSRGQVFAVKRGNGPVQSLEALGPAGVDYKPKVGEAYGILDKDGHFSPLDYGTKTGPMTSQERMLIGNRKAGHATQAERLAAFREMMNARTAGAQ